MRIDINALAYWPNTVSVVKSAVIKYYTFSA